MRRLDWISGLFWLGFSILVGIESHRLGLGSLHKPGPGFLFFWASVFLGIMSILVLLRARESGRREKTEMNLFQRAHLFKIILVLISVFLYAIFMETVGFILITLLLFIFLLGVIEKKRWVYTIFVSLMVTASTYLIFEVWLKSQLPKGILEFFRF